MIEKPKPDIEKLKIDLQSFLDQTRALIGDREAELRAIPLWALENYLEAGKSSASEAKWMTGELEKYREGPKQRKSEAQRHIAGIIKIMDEIRTEFPNRSEATIRENANERYGKLTGKNGANKADRLFYKDDKSLRKKIKQYLAKS